MEEIGILSIEKFVSEINQNQITFFSLSPQQIFCDKKRCEKREGVLIGHKVVFKKKQSHSKLGERERDNRMGETE